jgi:lipoate-protein ligase A
VVDRQAAEAEAIDVRRRTTGGGAVLVAPDAQVWLDLWVPRSHALWDDDVVRSALWLGEAWRGALEGLGAPALEIHRRPLLRRAWSDLVCFAGLGPGEVYLAAADPPDAAAPDRAGPGAKVMGLAQRRTRAGARFHTSAVLLWEPTPLLRLLKADPGRSSGGDATGGGGPSWASVARGLRSILPTGTGPLSDVEVIARVEDAVLGALP